MRDNPSLRQLVICHAAADAETALRLADFLETNLPLRVAREEGRITGDLDLIDTVEIALSAEAVLVLMSPQSVPAKWDRARWEPIFVKERAAVGCQLGFVLLEACRFPELFRRMPFFELADGLLATARLLKQWLLDPETPMTKSGSVDLVTEGLRAELADQPGMVFDLPSADSAGFIGAYARDFRAVHAIDGSERTAAGLFGQIGRVLGLALPGTVDESRDQLLEFCRAHRDLFVFRHVDPADRPLVSFGGRSSTIFVASESREAPTVDEVCEAFFSAGRDLDRCADLLGSALVVLPSLLSEDYDTGKRLGWAVRALLRNWDRNAEAIEFLDVMLPAARVNGDLDAILRIESDLCWLRGTPAAMMPRSAGPAQMSLFSAA